MTGRLRALKEAFEEKIINRKSSVIEVKGPRSLNVPASDPEHQEEEVTPTRDTQPSCSGTDQPSSSRHEVTGETGAKLKKKGTLNALNVQGNNSNNGTLKKNPSKSRLSPRVSRKAEEEDDTLSESSDFDMDDQVIIVGAIRAQDYEALEDFLSVDEIDANEVNAEGRRYLHECVIYDDQDACDIVLDAGGLINARDVNGWTAIHYAAAFSLTEMTQYLLDRGADPRKKTKKGETPEELTDDTDIVQKLQVARARRGLRSVSTVSVTEIEAAQEEFRRRTEERQQTGTEVSS